MSTEPDDDWKDGAACRGGDPDKWFPEKNDVQTREAARSICRECPVRLDCLRWALENRERWGIWGGVNMANRFACRGLHADLPDSVLEAAAQGDNPLNPRRVGRQRKDILARERTLRKMAAGGHTTNEIAKALGITPKGVKGIAGRARVEIPPDRRGPQLTAEEEAEVPRMVLRLVEGIERRRHAS